MILFFAFVFIIFSLALEKLTIGEGSKVIVDFGLSMIEIFGLIGVLFVGSQLLFKEIEGKTIFLLLSKPIKRQDFILGKFFGFSGTIFCIVFFQSLLFLGVLLFKHIEISQLIAWSLVFTFLKLEILLAIVFFFSTFMSNILTILVSLMMYVISHSFSLILDLFSRFQSSLMNALVSGLQLFFPPLEALNTKDVIGTWENFPFSYFAYNTFYSFLYILILLFVTVHIFHNKKFED
jgi:ABC-type transport system involved in multi-copper enzyme maturation permease subunit